MIDKSWIGHELPPHSALVEAGRLRLFAKAIGETDPMFSDEAAARAAGHRGLPAPPTMAFCLDMDVPDPFGYLAEMGVPVQNILHGEQSFTYHAPIHAGAVSGPTRSVIGVPHRASKSYSSISLPFRPYANAGASRSSGSTTTV